MRFYKSKKISKGVRIGISKSGPRISAGIPGLSLSTGMKGTYLNTSIPGTGISKRTKIGGTSKKSSRSKTNKSKSSSKVVNQQITFHYDGSTNSVEFYDENYNLITDESLIRKAKALPEYKQKLQDMKAEYKEEQDLILADMEEENNSIISIHKLAPDVMSKEMYYEYIDSLAPEPYKREIFGLAQKSDQEIDAELQKEAEGIFQGIFSGKKRKAYVSEHFEERKQYYYEQWNTQRLEFEKMEDEKEVNYNKESVEKYKSVKDALNKLVEGDINAIEEQLDLALSEVELELDFEVQFDIRNAGKTIYLDLDLPEIEMLPQKKPTQLASGKIKTKNKTKKELNEDYIICVFAYAIFFSAIVYNISPIIEDVVVSGYTQRRDKKGELVDEYVYSIKFKRETFIGISLGAVNPQKFCMTFENRCNILQSGVMKQIEPYE